MMRGTMQDLPFFARCLADPLNLRVLSLLRHGELCLCELREALGEDGARAIQRLRTMARAKIVVWHMREGWPAIRISERYTDLVETVFETFEEDLAWRGELRTDSDQLRASLGNRDGDWCGTASSRRAAHLGTQPSSDLLT